MMHVWSIIHSERLSGRTNTSLFHRHLRGPLFKNRVGLDDLWATPAPASLSRATTSLSIFPISPVPTIDFRTVMADEVISQGSEFFFFFLFSASIMNLLLFDFTSNNVGREGFLQEKTDKYSD